METFVTLHSQSILGMQVRSGCARIAKPFCSDAPGKKCLGLKGNDVFDQQYKENLRMAEPNVTNFLAICFDCVHGMLGAHT